ncbi:MAG: aminotransferase class V-fold PLP-dependent enzyme [Acidobacteriota bacterium]
MPVSRSTKKPAADPLLAWRREFPILKDTVYLISHSMGAMPRGAEANLCRYAREWRTMGIAGYDVWLPRLRATADVIGSLFGAPRGTVSLHQNVSTLTSIVLSAIVKPGGRRKVVTTDLNFPSVHYNWDRHRQLGLEIQMLQSPDGITIPTDMMVDAIDDQTLAVCIDHGIFRSGYLQEVGAIAEAARRHGAFSVVDAYQTVGCVPIDVTAWGIDFLLGGSHKWLCGGPGCSFLYTRPDLIKDLFPRSTGWFSHKRPFAFELDMDDADDAMRFATGTPNLPGIHAAGAGIELVKKVGVARIRKKNVRLLDRLIDMALAEGFKVNSPVDHARRSGVVCIDFPGAERAEAALLRKGIHLDYRPRCGVRVSAHFYTKDDELFSIIPELRKLRRPA